MAEQEAGPKPVPPDPTQYKDYFGNINQDFDVADRRYQNELTNWTRKYDSIMDNFRRQADKPKLLGRPVKGDDPMFAALNTDPNKWYRVMTDDYGNWGNLSGQLSGQALSSQGDLFRTLMSGKEAMRRTELEKYYYDMQKTKMDRDWYGGIGGGIFDILNQGGIFGKIGDLFKKKGGPWTMPSEAEQSGDIQAGPPFGGWNI